MSINILLLCSSLLNNHELIRGSKKFLKKRNTNAKSYLRLNETEQTKGKKVIFFIDFFGFEII